ncbi:MAG: citrate transporter, partial [Candidatus Marinimicrobia bacterium]|nr:citrate transporter [Candidatus Neomarinimicrobiota bacterium]
MATLQIILFIGLFIVISLAMFFRKIPALIALPVMGFIIPLIGGVSLSDTLQYVIGEGTLRLHTAYTVAFFGSMLSIFIQKTGIAENFIKIGAELAGDNPWAIAVLMLTLITLLFTTLGGLGAIIMVATIVLPIMSSIGIGSLTVVGIFLFGLSMGGILNAVNWALYINVMNLTINDIRPFAVIMFSITFLAALAYITIQVYKDGQNLNFKKIILVILFICAAITILILGYSWLPTEIQQMFRSTISIIGKIIKYLIGISITTFFIINLLRILFNKSLKSDTIHWTAY